MPPRAPFRRRKLARRLRQMREQAGFSAEEAAQALDKNIKSFYRIESGNGKIDVHLVRSMMDLYDVFAPDLLDMVRDAAQPGWFANFGLSALGYVDAEAEASTVRELAIAHVPGLLQTEHYMRAVFDFYPLVRSRSELANQIKMRMIRQSRLVSDDHPLNLIALIDEGALRQRIGGPDVMREQLNHLIVMSELATVTVLILPWSLGGHGGLNSAYSLLEFPDPDEPEMLYVEYVTGSIHVEKEDELVRARMLFEKLRSSALSPQDSVALIEQVLKEAI